MTYELIISEKPNAAKRIADSLADGKAVKKAEKGVAYYELSHKKKDIIVVSAVGHLYTVAEKKKSFSYPSFDLEWKATSDVSKDSAFSKKYLDLIKKLSKKAKTFTVACDYDVEGEVIGFNILRFACSQKDARRMKFSTLTKDDIVDSYNDASKTIDWGLAHAGETRHFLDWMYGINISRALTLAIKSTGAFKILSSGRVQGPALKILYEKEQNISAFKPVPYWQIFLEVEKQGIKIAAFHENDKIFSHPEAKKAFENALWKPASVKSIEKSESKSNPPFPFDLGSLQTESYKLFGISPKDTLATAQNLYTSGIISYPRTSSQKLPAKLNLKKVLKSLAEIPDYTSKANMVLAFDKLVPNEGSKTDPAHPAIYPTGLKPAKLTDREARIYDLIVKRFFATFGKPAIRESIALKIAAGGEVFAANGLRTKERNWFDLYEPYVKLKEEEWPPFIQGEALKINKLDLLQKETQPPKRYTPASIITELEKRGLGTKATRAEIVDSLYSRGYVHEESLKVTDIGTKIIETLDKYCPEIVDEQLTRHFESEMDEIMEGKKKENEVLDEAKTVLTKLLKEFKNKEKNIGEALKAANKETMDKESYIAKCPNCKEGVLRMRFSRKNRTRFIACDKYPDCKTTFAIPQSGGIKGTDKTCPNCSQPMIMVFMKKKKPQELCINKNCPSKKLEGSAQELTNGLVKIENGVEKIEKKCPKCGKELILRRSIYGQFIGCTGYPKCRYTENIKKKEEVPAGTVIDAKDI